MRALWVALLLAVVPMAAWAQNASNLMMMQGPVTPPLDSRYSYVEIRHDGTQTWVPPTLWLGTDDKAPPQPDYRMEMDVVPTPWYVPFVQRVTVDQGQYDQVLALTAALVCEDTVGDDGAEITISIFTAGRQTGYCFLEGDAARSYLAALKQIPGVPLSPHQGLESLAGFLGNAGTPSYPGDPPDGWVKLWYSGQNVDKPYPEIWFGQTNALPPRDPSNPNIVTRLVLSARQYQMMTNVAMFETCWADPYGITYDSDLTVDRNGKPSGCIYAGPQACHYLHVLYSLSLPGEEIDGIETVRRLAARLGCQPDPWPESAGG